MRLRVVLVRLLPLVGDARDDGFLDFPERFFFSLLAGVGACADSFAAGARVEEK